MYKRRVELQPLEERYKRERRNPKHSTWLTYRNMKDRCYNKNNDRYHKYGGRGIKVCRQWQKSFERFYLDMGLKPQSMSLERINVDGNYEPDNCKWATSTEQLRNKSLYENNTSGHRGVGLRKNGSWRSAISVGGKQIFIGYFKDKDDAISARLGAEASLW